MRIENKNGKINIVSVLIVFFSLIRIGMFLRMPFYAVGGSGYDDEYLLNLSESLFARDWLGVYGMTTLIKGISFPIFLALAKALCMPYGMLLGLFYVLAAYVFVKAFSNVINNQYILAFVYVYALYSPVSFSTEISQRVYRNAIVYPAVILVIGCILNLYFGRNESFKNKIVWLIATGVSFSFFYYIREDSIWLIPLLIGSLFICAIWYLFFDRNNKSKKNKINNCLCLLVPIAIFAIVSLTYRGINYKVYGVFAVSDRSSCEFGKLTGNIIKLEDEDCIDKNVWISKEKLEKVIGVCPSLKENKNIIIDNYSKWARESGEVYGDWSVWAIRTAFAEMGYYDSATHIDSFCKQINSELKQAVKDGKLKYDDAIHFTSQSRGIYFNELPSILYNTNKNIWDVVTYKDASCYSGGSGTTSQIRNFEAVTGGVAVYPTQSEYNCSGWIIDKKGRKIWLQLVDANGNIVADNISLTDSSDVASVFPEYNMADKCRFTFSSLDIGENLPTAINIYTEDNLIETISIDTQETENVILNIEANSIVENKDEYAVKNEYLNKIANTVIKCYRLISYIVFPVSIIAFILLIVIYIKKKNWSNFESVIILLGILTSAFILELGVTIFTEWLGGVWFYSSALPAVVYTFEAFALGYFTKMLKSFKER